MSYSTKRIHPRARNLAIGLCLTLSFFALMWGPCEWAIRLLSPEVNPIIDGAVTAQRTQYLWPISVGTFLACTFFAARGHTWWRGVFIPTLVAFILITVLTYIAYILILIFGFYSGGRAGFLLVTVVWPSLFYVFMAFILKRFYSKDMELPTSLLSRYSLLSLFGVPQLLVGFGPFLNIEWYFSVL